MVFPDLVPHRGSSRVRAGQHGRPPTHSWGTQHSRGPRWKAYEYKYVGAIAHYSGTAPADSGTTTRTGRERDQCRKVKFKRRAVS